MVNHSENFVDPETGAHTQAIESSWQKWKARIKAQYGTARDLFSTYIWQHVWMKEFGGLEDGMFNLWSQIAEHYELR